MEYKAYKELFDLEEKYWWFVGRRKIVFGLLDDILIEKKSKDNIILLAIILLVGFGFRLYNLESKSMWFDEVWTIQFAKKSFSEIPYQLVKDDAPPLYHFVLHLWLCVSESSFWLRFLSLVFGVLVIYMTYLVGRTLFGIKEGASSAFLVAVSFINISESQTVRSYPLYGFFSLLSIYFFYKALKENKFAYWFGFIVSTASSVYTHYFGFLLLFSEVFFYVVYWRQHKSSMMFFLTSVILVVFFYSPWLNLFSTEAGSYWHEKNIRKSEIMHVKSQLIVTYHTFGLLSNSKYLIPVFLILILNAIKSSYFEKKYEFNLLLSILLTSIITPTILVKTFQAKFIIYVTSLFYILASKGLLSIKNKKILLSAAFIILVLSSTKLIDYYHSEVADWRSVAEYIKLNAWESDLIIIEPSTEQVSFRYYFGWDSRIHTVTEYSGEPVRTKRVLSEFPHKRTWVVYADENLMGYDSDGKVSSWFEEHAINKKRFTWITVYLLDL